MRIFFEKFEGGLGGRMPPQALNKTSFPQIMN